MNVVFPSPDSPATCFCISEELLYSLNCILYHNGESCSSLGNYFMPLIWQIGNTNRGRAFRSHLDGMLRYPG